MHPWRNQRENFLKIPTDKWKWKHNSPKPTGCSKSISKREVYSNIILPQETRKISNKPPNLKQREKEEQTKPTGSRRKEVVKAWAEINEIETRKTITKVNENKIWLSEKINKIDKTFVRLIKKKRKRTQINKIRNEKEDTTDTTEIQRVIRDCQE